MSTGTITFAERAELVDALAIELERIAHRLRQGAIPCETAALRLSSISDAVGALDR